MRRAMYIALLSLFFLSVFLIYLDRQSQGALTVNFLNVGQGDATLINIGLYRQILIDGGPNGKILMNELAKVMPANDRTIEVIIATHPDKDHIAGLIEVLKYYNVKLFLDNQSQGDSIEYQTLENILQEKKIEKKALMQGSKIVIFRELEISVFNPVWSDKISLEKNEQSIVTRLDYGVNSFLFTGDIAEPEENKLIFQLENLDVDWLKVAHHGSKTASSKKFLEKVTPEYAIISVGKNNYGHPTEETLERLQTVGAKIIRTDTQGTLEILCKNPKTKCKLKEK